MMTRTLSGVCALVLALAVAGCSGTSSTASRPAQAGEKGSTYLTGSYLPQDVNQNGRVNNSVNNVDVIDQNRIQQSGQSNVRDVLIQQGAVH